MVYWKSMLALERSLKFSSQGDLFKQLVAFHMERVISGTLIFTSTSLWFQVHQNHHRFMVGYSWLRGLRSQPNIEFVNLRWQGCQYINESFSPGSIVRITITIFPSQIFFGRIIQIHVHAFSKPHRTFGIPASHCRFFSYSNVHF